MTSAAPSPTCWSAMRKAGRASARRLLLPADPSLGVFAALEQAAQDSRIGLQDFLSRVDAIVHGTTITTNAVLTRTGARTGFITTRGFRDLLAMRRGMKTGERYDLELAPPPVLIERALTLTVTERIDANGRVITPLVEEDVRAAADILRDAGTEAVAVSYLWSFLNPAHELRTREILQNALDGVYISLSSEVLPQIRVYERHSTTALNSYTGPPLARYLQNLEARLGENGFSGVLNIMQSNGGCMSPKVTSRFAVNTLLSGPRAGPGPGFITAVPMTTKISSAWTWAAPVSTSPWYRMNGRWSHRKMK